MGTYPVWYLMIWGFVFGTITGSFLCVVAERVPKGLSVGGRSSALAAGNSWLRTSDFRVSRRPREAACCGAKLPAFTLRRNWSWWRVVVRTATGLVGAGGCLRAEQRWSVSAYGYCTATNRATAETSYVPNRASKTRISMELQRTVRTSRTGICMAVPATDVQLNYSLRCRSGWQQCRESSLLDKVPPLRCG